MIINHQYFFGLSSTLPDAVVIIMEELGEASYGVYKGVSINGKMIMMNKLGHL